MKSGIIALSLLLGVMSITAPAYGNSEEQLQQDVKDPVLAKEFEADLKKMLSAISADKNYKRMPLDTKEDEAWLTSQMFRLWDHNITKEEFVGIGLIKYPANKYELNFIADRLSRKR